MGVEQWQSSVIVRFYPDPRYALPSPPPAERGSMRSIGDPPAYSLRVQGGERSEGAESSVLCGIYKLEIELGTFNHNLREHCAVVLRHLSNHHRNTACHLLVLLGDLAIRISDNCRIAGVSLFTYLDVQRQ